MNIDNDVKTLVFDDFVKCKKDIVAFVNFLLEGDEPEDKFEHLESKSQRMLNTKSLP